MPVRLVIFDCDMTLWNHSDVSSLQLPFAANDGDTVRNGHGALIPLFPQVREVLRALEQRGYLLSVCSWNDPEPVYQALELLGLRGYFRHPKVEPHPHKDEMIAHMLEEFAAEGIVLRPAEVVFIDDRTLHTEAIRARLPGLHVLQMWVDLPDHRSLLDWLGGQTAADSAPVEAR